jgi:putative sigma-54 modulation protein
MRIQVRSKQIEADETLRTRIERRLEFALGRLSRRIRRVNVQIRDINGARGGEDKSCRIEVRLQPKGRVLVTDTAPDVETALDRASHRAARAVTRTIRRATEITRAPFASARWSDTFGFDPDRTPAA